MIAVRPAQGPATRRASGTQRPRCHRAKPWRRRFPDRSPSDAASRPERLSWRWTKLIPPCRGLSGRRREIQQRAAPLFITAKTNSADRPIPQKGPVIEGASRSYCCQKLLMETPQSALRAAGLVARIARCQAHSTASGDFAALRVGEGPWRPLAGLAATIVVGGLCSNAGQTAGHPRYGQG
jgi:hypothetical protein